MFISYFAGFLPAVYCYVFETSSIVRVGYMNVYIMFAWILVRLTSLSAPMQKVYYWLHSQWWPSTWIPTTIVTSLRDNFRSPLNQACKQCPRTSVKVKNYYHFMSRFLDLFIKTEFTHVPTACDGMMDFIS